MGKKNIEIELYTYKNVVFGCVTYISPGCIMALKERNAEKKIKGQAWYLYVDSEDDSNIDGNDMTIGVRPGMADGKAFCFAYCSEEVALQFAEAFSEIIEKINKHIYDEPVQEPIRPGEIKPVLINNN